MPGTTTIEWADASWNFVTGCEEVSPGCDHCYAKTIAKRFRGAKAFPNGFDLTLHPERLQWPLKEKKPSKIFVNSMSDLFHKDVTDDFILQGFETMLKADWHIYQILTKRPSRLVNTGLTQKILQHIYALTGSWLWPRHIWLGVSVENVAYAWRINALRRVPVPVRFVSAEPLLGSLETINLDGIAWVIAGAESGHGARPMDEDWVRELRDHCQYAQVKFFYKQNAVRGHKVPLPELDGKVWNEFPALESE